MAKTSYRAEDITVLTGLDPVRKRPDMFIGGVDSVGLHHLLWEIVDNSIDEVMNGFATTIEVELDRDGKGITVKDNGRGIPVDVHRKHGKPALELILTTLHAGGKFGGGNYTYSGGLHGVGASVVNALAKYLVATVRRDGFQYEQSFAQGKPLGPMKQVREARGTGTSIYFQPDPEIFPQTCFDAEQILEVLESRCYLHGTKIVFRDRTTEEIHRLEPGEGIRQYLKKLVKHEKRDAGYDHIFYHRVEEDPRIEVALQWTEESAEAIRSYVNGIRTPLGGTHDLGLKAGVVRAVRDFMDTHNLHPKGLKLGAEDIRDGLRGVLSVYVAEPQFKGQTKERLNNPEMNTLVANALAPALEQFLNQNRSIAEAIVGRIIEGARTRAAARAATKLVSRKSAVSHRLNLPGKLADCSSTQPEESEIFIVEGDSAGGSAKQARDRRFQAILPLRGKVLNTEQASLRKIGANKEITDLVSALGCGIGPKFDIERLRYGRVVILTDADSDGHHIAGLLLTFFYRHLPELLRAGNIYLGRPPLYRIRFGKLTCWAWDDRQRDEILEKHRARSKADITRFKGLGEMSPAQLKETTLDPKTRTLFRILVTDEEQADRAITDCFGRDSAPRFEFVMEQAAEADDLDV
ncbi:MAG: type IIA DNA topoisomerase subunit B [Armatimonadetes bacterium]|nr:type IIA DNA topoisomerase subunit B [Armatimonadota bacterium]